MNLSVITITCRETPRFDDMAQALVANLAKHDDVHLEWIVVDEKLVHNAATAREDRLFDARGAFVDHPIAQRVDIYHVAPKRSPWRGPDVEIDRPDQNSARNTGLAYATGDYIAFVDDCTIVGASWLETLIECAEIDAGYRCHIAFPRDAVFRMPADGLVRIHEVADRLVEAQATTVAGCAFGAPRAAFEAIGGFDESYGGESGCEDLDAFVRLTRTGLVFYGSRAGWAYPLKAADARDEICRIPEVFHAEKNQQRFNALLGDRGRTSPAQPQPSIAELRARLCGHRDLAQGDIARPTGDNGDRRQPYETPLVEEIPFPNPPQRHLGASEIETPSDGLAGLSPSTFDAAPALSGDPDPELERDPTSDPPREDGPVTEP